ncbi:MAG: LysR substrate-binding domain-containing protein [Proteobacteria bacterium]|nr:LysR substrate-binding domain-containing protein [Pseudomonadota bacterium]
MATWNRNVSMRALRAFCTAAERGSFRRAAEDLFLTASAVSHQIKQLEEAMGVLLFQRQPRSLKLTGSGRALLDELSPVLEDLDLVIERNCTRGSRIALRISVQPFFASELLMPRLSEFLADNPGISITVDTADEEPDRHDKTADASVRLFSSPPLEGDRLFPLRLIPMGSPALYDSVEVVAGRITSEFPLVVHNARPGAWQKWQKSSGIRLPRQATTIRLNSMIAVARAAEQGLGAALMPAQLCNDRIESGALTPLFDHELESTEAYYLISRPRKPESDRIGTFRNWVLQEFALGR